MLALKAVSIIYMCMELVFFIFSGLKSRNAEESTGSRLLSILQGMALAYIIMN